jgi:HEAT repeat protein
MGLIGAIAWAHPKGRWRIDTLALKLRGEIPEYSLSDVLAAQLPTGWSEEKILPLTGSLVMGRVLYSGREPSGPCPVIFDTPLGKLHGRLIDDDILEFLIREQLDGDIYHQPEAHVSKGDVVIDAGAHLGTFHSQGLPAPDRAIAVLHELLQSKEPRLRLHAAWTLLCLGDAATDFLPDLLNLLDSDEDEGVRFMATCAFAIAGAGDPRTVPVLTALLSDKSEKVRLAAVGSLGQLGVNASAAVPALHARFVDASEAEDVRRAALHALARTARGAQCAELVPEVLQASSSFTGYHEVEWTLATGRLAAEVPGTPAAKAAREALAPRAADMEGYDDVALAAVCGLAWIACAERDTALASPMKEVLVSTMEDLVRTPADVQIPLDETGQAAVEASINLVLWPEMKVDPAPIVGVLDRCAAPDVPRYLREWAAGQRARLP